MSPCDQQIIYSHPMIIRRVRRSEQSELKNLCSSDKRWIRYFEPRLHELWVEKALNDIKSDDRVVLGAFNTGLVEGEAHVTSLVACIFLKLSSFENAIEFKNLILPKDDPVLTPEANIVAQHIVAQQLIKRAVLFCEVRGIQKIEIELPQEEHEIISLFLKQQFKVVALRERYSFGNLVCTLERTIGAYYRGDPFDKIKFALWLLNCFVSCDVNNPVVEDNEIFFSFVIRNNKKIFSRDTKLSHSKRLRGLFWIIADDDDSKKARMVLEKYNEEPVITLVLCDQLNEEVKKQFNSKGITYFDSNDALEIAGGELSSLSIPIHISEVGGVITVLEQDQIEEYAKKVSLTYYLLSGLHQGLNLSDDDNDDYGLFLAIYCPNWNNQGPGIVGLSQIVNIQRPPLRDLLKEGVPPDSVLNESDLSFYKTYSEDERIARLECSQIVVFPKPLRISNGWVSGQSIREYLKREISDNSCNTAYLDEKSVDALREVARKNGRFLPTESMNANDQESQEYRFKVGLSFPGEDRNKIRQVADFLSEYYGKECIFFDEYYISELARPNLDQYLGKIYGKQCKLVVPFFSSDYKTKQWCKLEWRVMKSIIFDGKRDDAIMPFRLDSTEIDGLLDIDGYVDAVDMSPKEIADYIRKRVDTSP